MIASTTLGTHNPRISAQTVTNHLREIGERPPYTMYVLYAAFLSWPSICMKEFGSEKIIYDKMTAVRTYENFSLIGLWYMH